MKKPEITITLEFKEGIRIDSFEEEFLNTNILKNYGANLIRIRHKENKIIIDFYNITNKRRIFKYKKLLTSVVNCINSMEEIRIHQLNLFNMFKGTMSDMQGMCKQFEDLQNYYKKLTNHE